MVERLNGTRRCTSPIDAVDFESSPCQVFLYDSELRNIKRCRTEGRTFRSDRSLV
jgi:hypothetical protein